MSEQQIEPGAPTQDPVDPQAQPVAGGQDDDPPAQGEGAEDSY